MALDRAIEWSVTLECTDEDDAKWEWEFRERCRRELAKLTGTKKTARERACERGEIVDAFALAKESHNATPQQHQTATSAEKHNETDS